MNGNVHPSGGSIASARQIPNSQSDGEGLLGPESMAWRVIGHPLSIVGGLRSLIVQSLHPLAMAGVAEHSDYRERPLNRLRRTAYYVAATTFGDTRTALAAAERVRRVHVRVRGIDPITGQPYSAADPDTQLWVHCVEWHSFLAAHRACAIGSLTPELEDDYLAEGALIGSLLGTPRERVPASRDEYRDYFASVRSQLCVSEPARAAIGFVVDPPLTRELLPYQPAIRLLGAAAVATVPGHLRELAGIDRPRAVDAAALAAVRPLGAALTLPVLRGLPAALFGGEAREVGERARARMAA